MNSQGLIVISGPSGVGKSTICRRLCEMLDAAFSVSVTTRAPRGGEQDGREYRFISMPEYEALVRSGGLLESAMYQGHGYGTPAEPVHAALRDGRSMVLEIDVRGAEQVRQTMPAARFFFVLPPSHEELSRRLFGRATDSPAVIEKRLAHARCEIRAARDSGVYDFFVVNDDRATTENKIYQLIKAGETTE